jgi:hypothetical protein
MGDFKTGYLSLDAGRQRYGSLGLVAIVACAVSIACSVSTILTLASVAPQPPAAAELGTRLVQQAGAATSGAGGALSRLNALQVINSPKHKFAVELVTPRQLQVFEEAHDARQLHPPTSFTHPPTHHPPFFHPPTDPSPTHPPFTHPPTVHPPDLSPTTQLSRTASLLA